MPLVGISIRSLTSFSYLSLLLASFAVAAFVWATRSGQFDELETPSQRMLIDDEYARDESDYPKT